MALILSGWSKPASELGYSVGYVLAIQKAMYFECYAAAAGEIVSVSHSKDSPVTAGNNRGRLTHRVVSRLPTQTD